MNKIIMHIDMDAFFASVEIRDDPALKNKPIAVVGSNERTVLVSPSYEARAFGVKTGMTKPQAKRLCPEIKFVVASSGKYTKACREILKILYTFTPEIEVYSIDEFFINVTHSCHLFGIPTEAALEMKKAIKKNLGLPCSIGISYNKFLAKIASDNNKPDGLFVINKDNKEKVLSLLEVSSVWGIGKSTTQKLNRIGIETLGDLVKVSCKFLEDRFGKQGLLLYDMARGKGATEIITAAEQEEAKSIGHSMTFRENTNDIKVLKGYLLELCMKVSERLRRDDFVGKCIALTVRYKSFKTFTKQKSIDDFINSTTRIHKVATNILGSIKLQESVRLIGVSVSSLKHDDYKGFLFKEEEKKHNLDIILDKVSSRFGRDSITYASLVNKKEHKRIISPAWRPVGTRNY